MSASTESWWGHYSPPFTCRLMFYTSFNVVLYQQQVFLHAMPPHYKRSDGVFQLQYVNAAQCACSRVASDCHLFHSVMTKMYGRIALKLLVSREACFYKSGTDNIEPQAFPRGTIVDQTWVYLITESSFSRPVRQIQQSVGLTPQSVTG